MCLWHFLSDCQASFRLFMSVLLTCINVYVPHLYLVSVAVRRGCKIPLELELQMVSGCWELNLEEQLEFLSTEPSLQMTVNLNHLSFLRRTTEIQPCREHQDVMAGCCTGSQQGKERSCMFPVPSVWTLPFLGSRKVFMAGVSHYPCLMMKPKLGMKCD